MVDPKIDSDELDWKLERLRRLAEDMYEATGGLDDSTFRRFLYKSTQGTAYSSELYSRLHAIVDDFWKFRLALLWDALPQRREAALRFCRVKYEMVSRTLVEGFTKEPLSAILAIKFQHLGEASGLLERPEQVETSQFAKSVYALAEVYALSFVNKDQDEWMTLKTFYQDLYSVFNPGR